MPRIGEERCDHCKGPLGNCRVIAGSSDAQKHFCSYACYDLWKATKHTGLVAIGQGPMTRLAS